MRKKAVTKPKPNLASERMDTVTKAFPNLELGEVAAAKFAAQMSRFATRNDGWYNSTTGIGTSRDKSAYNQFENSLLLSVQFLDSIYNESIPGRIIDKIVDDATSEGFDLVIQDDDTQEKATEIMKMFDGMLLGGKVNQAAKWGRLYGISALMLITDDSAALDQPLNLETCVLKGVFVLERQDIQAVKTYETDARNPLYGEPSVYKIQKRVGQGTTETLDVHVSRLVLFEGLKVPYSAKQMNGGFPLSALQRPHAIIEQHAMSWGAVQNILQDAGQAVFKMKGLYNAAIAGNMALIQARMSALDLGRSVAKAIMIDNDNEAFERHDYGFVGYAQIIEKFETRLALAAEMPVSILFGTSATGLNATGDGDRAVWESTVKSYQKNYVTPAWRKLVVHIMHTIGMDGTDDFKIEPKPIRAMNASETAIYRKAVADTDKIYIDSQVITPEEVALARFGPRGFSQEISIDTESRRQILEADRK
ncbi:MAG: DUF1073 domain-containing protein, partial [Nitrosospira sp.]|nr:DUF1073 domain-containing protein [Nitrosospira sp.]